MDACLGQKWGKKEIPVFFIYGIDELSVGVYAFRVFPGVKSPFSGLYVVCVLWCIVLADYSRCFCFEEFLFNAVSHVKVSVYVKFPAVVQIAGIQDAAVVFKVIGDQQGRMLFQHAGNDTAPGKKIRADQLFFVQLSLDQFNFLLDMAYEDAFVSYISDDLGCKEVVVFRHDLSV